MLVTQLSFSPRDPTNHCKFPRGACLLLQAVCNTLQHRHYHHLTTKSTTRASPPRTQPHPAKPRQTTPSSRTRDPGNYPPVSINIPGTWNTLPNNNSPPTLSSRTIEQVSKSWRRPAAALSSATRTRRTHGANRLVVLCCCCDTLDSGLRFASHSRHGWRHSFFPDRTGFHWGVGFHRWRLLGGL